MTKLTNPLVSLDARGRIGKLIALTRRQKINIAEKMPFPDDPKSLAQLSWRHMFQKVVALWHALSASEKQEWESSARRHHMTGYAWFLSQALRPNPGIFLPLQGGIMSGDIDMAGNQILDLPDPTLAQEPATRAYLLALLNFLSLSDTPADYTGEALKVARVNAAENALEFATISGGYTEGARVWKSSGQDIPNNTETIVSFDRESYDTDNIHDNAVNNSRLTCKTAGKYFIMGNCLWASSATGYRHVHIYEGGNPAQWGNRFDAPGVTTIVQLVQTVLDLSINDYVELDVRQTSGGVLRAGGGVNYYTTFAMQRIG